MTITYELDLETFEAWGYAVKTLNRIIDVGMCEQLEATLVQVYPEGMTET